MKNLNLKSSFRGLQPYLLVALLVAVAYSSIASWKESVDRSIQKASFAYSRQVISYGLTFANSDDEVMQTIQKWKDDRWGAQIAALRTLCDNDFHFVEGLGGDGTGQRICRLIR